MISLDVRFVAIDNVVWTTWPHDRALIHLANDALGIERRIRKRVDELNERSRYRQICEWIEMKGLEHSEVDPSRTWRLVPDSDGSIPSANHYVQLVDALTDAYERLPRSATISAHSRNCRAALGRTFFAPDGAVAEQGELFERFSAELLDTLFPDASALTLNRWKLAADYKARAYADAARMGNAMIEIVGLSSRASGTTEVAGPVNRAVAP